MAHDRKLLGAAVGLTTARIVGETVAGWQAKGLSLLSESCVYPDATIGGHGVRRARKICRAQQLSITRSRTPPFHSRIRSVTIRQRLTLLWTVGVRTGSQLVFLR